MWEKKLGKASTMEGGWGEHLENHEGSEYHSNTISRNARSYIRSQLFFRLFLIFFYRKNSDGTIEDQWRNEQNSVVLGRNCCENILRELVDEFDRDQMIPGIRHSRRCCNRWPMVIYVCIYIYMGDSLNCGTPKNTLKWSFLVGKPMFVLYHHFRKHRFQIISK